MKVSDCEPHFGMDIIFLEALHQGTWHSNASNHSKFTQHAFSLGASTGVLCLFADS